MYCLKWYTKILGILDIANYAVWKTTFNFSFSQLFFDATLWFINISRSSKNDKVIIYLFNYCSVFQIWLIYVYVILWIATGFYHPNGCQMRKLANLKKCLKLSQGCENIWVSTTIYAANFGASSTITLVMNGFGTQEKCYIWRDAIFDLCNYLNCWVHLFLVSTLFFSQLAFLVFEINDLSTILIPH